MLATEAQPRTRVWEKLCPKIQQGDAVRLDYQPIYKVVLREELANGSVVLKLRPTNAEGIGKDLYWTAENAVKPTPAKPKPTATTQSDREPTPQGDRIKVSWNFQLTGGETREKNRGSRFAVVDKSDRWLIANIHQAKDPYVISNLEREPVKVGSQTDLPHTAAVLSAIPKTKISGTVKPVGTARWPAGTTRFSPAPEKPEVQAEREPMPVAAAAPQLENAQQNAERVKPKRAIRNLPEKQTTAQVSQKPATEKPAARTKRLIVRSIFKVGVGLNRLKGKPCLELREKTHPILPRSKVVSSINSLLYIH